MHCRLWKNTKKTANSYKFRLGTIGTVLVATSNPSFLIELGAQQFPSFQIFPSVEVL